MTGAIDHLVYGVPELSSGVARIGERFGVVATPGGSHEGRGSHNALLSLGGESYLEIIAPDPNQPDPGSPRPFGLDTLAEPRLITFAVHAAPAGEPRPKGAAGERLAAWRARAAGRGYAPGPVAAMSRRRTDGSLLRWHLCQQPELPFGGAVPFLIDWGAADSPASTAPAGCRLLELEVLSPEPRTVTAALHALGVAVTVRSADRPGLRATLATPRGTVELT